MRNPTWDLAHNDRQFAKILQKPSHALFKFYFARLLSRVSFYDVFHHYISPRQFQKHFKQVRKYMKTDPLGAGRIEFWDWLYKYGFNRAAGR